MSGKRVLFAAALGFMASSALAAVRLTYDVNGSPVPVAWPVSAFPIRYEIDRRLASSVPSATIDRAFSAWTSIEDAKISFSPSGVVDVQPGQDGENSVTFVDDLFKNQNFLALTTNWYDNSGKIIESDIQIDPSAVAGGYNMQQLVQHEVGHLLGLDHSAVLSSAMYPWVGRGAVTGLDSDERITMANVYPKDDPTLAGATLEGRVTGDNGGIFAAQVVALNENGEPVATALTNQQGQFTLERIPAGTYRLYVEPLDGPVDVGKFSGLWRSAKVTSFPTQFVGGGPIRIESGGVYGNLNVNSAGTIQLNPKWVGAFAPGSTDLSLGAMPVMLSAGQTVNIAVGGDGFISGMTRFDVPTPGIQRISDFTYASNYVYATFRVAANAPAGSEVILVQSGNESAALTGALRIAASTRLRVARK